MTMASTFASPSRSSDSTIPKRRNPCRSIRLCGLRGLSDFARWTQGASFSSSIHSASATDGACWMPLFYTGKVGKLCVVDSCCASPPVCSVYSPDAGAIVRVAAIAWFTPSNTARRRLTSNPQLPSRRRFNRWLQPARSRRFRNDSTNDPCDKAFVVLGCAWDYGGYGKPRLPVNPVPKITQAHLVFPFF